MDISALDRVLMGFKHERVPNKENLLEDLEWANTMFQTVKDADSPKLARIRYNRAAKIQSTAKRLAELLAEDEADSQLIRRFHPPMSGIMDAVKDVVSAADKAMSDRQQF